MKKPTPEAESPSHKLKNSQRRPYTLKRALGERLKFATTMLVDTLILAFWVIVVWNFNTRLVGPLGQMAGLDRFVLRSLQWILGLPVIFQALLFTFADLSGALQSTVEAIKDQWHQEK